MTAQQKDTGNTLGVTVARNVLGTLLSQVLPPFVAIATVPAIVHGLGVDRYGVLAIVWVILGYSTFLELGLSRALTKFVAQYIERGENHKIPQAVWTTLAFQALLGAIAGAVFALCAGWIGHYLAIPAELRDEGIASLRLIGLLPPFLFAIASLGGLLIAGLHFGAANLIQVLSSAITYVAIAIAASTFHAKTTTIVLIIIAIKILTVAVLYGASLAYFPILRTRTALHAASLRPLLNFGGWIAATSVLGQFVLRIDRFLISAMISVAAVTYYSVPYDVLTRTAILPAAVVAALFPTFSGLQAGPVSGDHRLQQLYVRATKYLLLFMVPMVLVTIVFGRDALRAWMGSQFADHAGRTLELLAISLPLSSLVWVPVTLLQSAARPDFTAKVLLAESVGHLALCWLLVRWYGIEGAALAFLVRCVVDVSVHYIAVAKLRLVPARCFRTGPFTSTLGLLAALTVAMIAIYWMRLPLLMRAAAAALALGAFAGLAWRFTLDGSDKHPVNLLMNRVAATLRRNAASTT